MDFKNFDDLLPDILAEAETEKVYVSVMSIPDRKKGKGAAYHNNCRCRHLEDAADKENIRIIPLLLAKWLDYTELCGTCEQ